MAAEGGNAVTSSSSERKIFLHPLAIITISDHYTCIESGASVKPMGSKVLGLLWGKQQGLEVSIMDGQELAYTQGDDGVPVISAEKINSQKELYTQVYKNYELLGWYSVGFDADGKDMAVHREMTKYNESPFFLLMHPKPDPEATDLPISLYESKMVMGADDTPTIVFVTSEFQLQTMQAERITMERIAKATPTDGVAALDLHMNELTSSLRTLGLRFDALLAFLNATKTGQVPTDYRLLRQVSSICNQLPAVDTTELRDDFVTEYNDMLMVNYLASVTKSNASLSDLIDKHAVVVSQRHHRL